MDGDWYHWFILKNVNGKEGNIYIGIYRYVCFDSREIAMKAEGRNGSQTWWLKLKRFILR